MGIISNALQHAGEFIQLATSGAKGALFVKSHNADAPAVDVEGGGDLLRVRTLAGSDRLSLTQAGALTSASTLTATAGGVVATAGNVTATAGSVVVSTAGQGLNIKEGSNAKMGTAVLVDGAVTVATTAVAATSRILLTSQVDGGTPGWLRVSDRTAATSFVITSSSATDTSTVAWVILTPAA